jgi:RNA polymerase sigma-70 factor (ECF subfamily)
LLPLAWPVAQAGLPSPSRSAGHRSCQGVTRGSLPAMSLYMPDSELRRTRFDALFRDYHPAVRAYARRRVPPEVVDDIVSETFLVVWRRLDDVPQAPLPWLLAVTRNVVGTEWRGASRRERLWLKAQSGHVGGYDPGEPENADGRVLEALAGLKERDREALTLVAWDGLTPAQAAAVLGEPPARFRQRLHRAGRRLRAKLPADLRPDESTQLRRDHAPTGGPA